jgi:hypothetical protein
VHVNSSPSDSITVSASPRRAGPAGWATGCSERLRGRGRKEVPGRARARARAVRQFVFPHINCYAVDLCHVIEHAFDLAAVDVEFASNGALAGTCLVQRTYRVFEY